jgi:hypothetical protein
MTRRGWVAWVALAACGTPAPPPPEAAPPGPELQATLEPNPAPPEPAQADDAGPGGLSTPVVDALRAVFPKGRRLRCEAVPELAGEGALTAVWLGPKEEHLRAATVDGGWFAAVAPTSEGEGLVLRGGRAVARLSWKDASTGAWAACAVEPVEHYQILGLVQTTEGEEVAGAQVRGCEQGAVARTNAQGRFELPGITGRTCPLLAIVDDAGGLGRSEPTPVKARPGDETIPTSDVLVEITLGSERVERGDVAAQAARLHDLKERQHRNGLAAEAEAFRRRVDEAHLGADARAVADRWIADLDARAAEDAAVLGALARHDAAGLVAYWLHDL